MDPDQFDRLIRLQTQFLRIQRDLLNASFDLEELTRELLVANPPPIILERSRIKTKSAVAILRVPTKIIKVRIIVTLKSNNEIHSKILG